LTNGSHDRLDRIEALQLQAQEQINANAHAIAALTAEAETDRKMIWAALQQHDVVLSRLDTIAQENQQILNYLFGQQRRNGHDG